MPHRVSVQSDAYSTLFMPSRIDTIPTTCIKVVAVPRRSGEGGLPATTLVMDEITGSLDAVVNARSLTALRTAAASALATRICLGNSAAPTRLVMFGAGAQILAHAAILIAIYPSIRHCTVVNRSYNSRLVTLLDHLRLQLPGVEFVGIAWDLATHGPSAHSVEKAIRSASIICTATPSTKPLFPAEWVNPGTHLNLVGSYTPQMHEISTALVNNAKVIILDSYEACKKEAGELITAKGSLDKALELGELEPNSDVIGDAQEKPITIFKSVGVSVMDAAIAHLIVFKAREMGRGVVVPYD
ncbi:hypothetical protein M422DRAFT_58082 [Sphaerobolus stellatus SS14]|nr:hypothetical protein M422DRAFT_58082 [Sphaerobolus stellatus SS14]